MIKKIVLWLSRCRFGRVVRDLHLPLYILGQRWILSFSFFRCLFRSVTYSGLGILLIFLLLITFFLGFQNYIAQFSILIYFRDLLPFFFCFLKELVNHFIVLTLKYLMRDEWVFVTSIMFILVRNNRNIINENFYFFLIKPIN